jgi:hypothetical protein
MELGTQGIDNGSDKQRREQTLRHRSKGLNTNPIPGDLNTLLFQKTGKRLLI